MADTLMWAEKQKRPSANVEKWRMVWSRRVCPFMPMGVEQGRCLGGARITKSTRVCNVPSSWIIMHEKLADLDESPTKNFFSE